VADLGRFAEPPPSYERWKCNQIPIAKVLFEKLDLRAAYVTLLLQQGLAADAETQARAALEIAPESAPLSTLAGRIALRQGRLPEAIESLSEAVRRQPDLLAAHAPLGQGFWRQGATSAAASELAKAAPLDSYGNIHFLLFEAYRKLGKTEQASAAPAGGHAKGDRRESARRRNLRNWTGALTCGWA
jgi:predicted Zn-dependent protease